jgi:hypothetical protein
MTDINSQEQNLLGNKIFPKSGDFCILKNCENWQNIRNERGTFQVDITPFPINYL